MECEKHCEIAVGLQEIDSRSKSNLKRLDKLDERMDRVEDVTASIAILAENQKHMDVDLKEIKADVKTQSLKKGKEVADYMVECALFKSACGYEVEEWEEKQKSAVPS